MTTSTVDVPAGWIDVGREVEFVEGRPTVRTVGGIEIGVINLGSSEFRAIRNLCPHRGAPIGEAGFVTGTFVPSQAPELHNSTEMTVVRCPWHKWEFDLATGEPVYGISSMLLQVYDVQVVGGHVFVNPIRRRPTVAVAEPLSAELPLCADSNGRQS